MNRCCCFILDSTGAQPSRLPLVASEDACAPVSKSLHRIISAGAKWLAPQQTPDRHTAPAHSTMFFDRFTRIFGAARNKAARRRQPRRDYCFVKTQKRNQNKPHRLLPYSLSLLERVRVRVYYCHTRKFSFSATAQ